MKIANLIVVGIASVTLTGLQAQTRPITTEGEGEDPVRPGLVPGPQKLDLKSRKLNEHGVDLGSLTTINTGRELIAVHAPAGCRIRALEDGRILQVHLDNASRNWITIKYHSEILAEFEQQKVLELARPLLGPGIVEVSERSALGRKSFAFAVKTPTGGDVKHVRMQVFPCQSGTLSISATAFEADSAEVFSVLQRIISSLQIVHSEQELQRPVPVPTG